MKKSLILLLPLSLAVGCGGDSEQAAPDADLGAAPAPVDDTAEAAVQAIVDGLRNGQPVAVWNALPASYQSDTNSVVQTFGQNMDPQIWASITDLLGSIHKLLVDKHDFVVNHAAIAESDDPEAAKAAVTHVAGLLKTILDTAGDLEKLKTFDGADFMTTTGASLVQQLDAISKLGSGISPAAATGPVGLAALENVKIETVTSTDATATLKITSPDGKVETSDFVKVEGKWVPSEMADEWDQQIADTQKGLAGLKDQEQVAQMRMAVMMFSGMGAGMLAQLQNAQSQDEFNAAVDQIQQSAMGMMGGGMGGPPAGGFGPPQEVHESPAGIDSPGHASESEELVPAQ